jgi:hypothetical protein
MYSSNKNFYTTVKQVNIKYQGITINCNRSKLMMNCGRPAGGKLSTAWQQWWYRLKQIDYFDENHIFGE